MRVKIGLIGDQISESLSPLLHSCASEIAGISCDYHLLVPAEQQVDFISLYERCRDNGFDGLNITFPYKQSIPEELVIEGSAVRSIGAINTVLFKNPSTVGMNTDYTGFVDAYRYCFAETEVGSVTIFGAGGVGRAVAFGLIKLGVSKLQLVDSNQAQARELAAALLSHNPDMHCEVYQPESDIPATDGLVNCTPVGMQAFPGSAIPASMISTATWCFDAIYYPVRTEFLRQAEAAGLPVMSGIDLFFFQGINSFKAFSSIDVDPKNLSQEIHRRLQSSEIAGDRKNLFNKYCQD